MVPNFEDYFEDYENYDWEKDPENLIEEYLKLESDAAYEYEDDYTYTYDYTYDCPCPCDITFESSGPTTLREIQIASLEFAFSASKSFQDLADDLQKYF